MRQLLLALSFAFCVYGLLPYRKAVNIDTTQPNQLVIEQQECGCPCPDAAIIKGQLNIPADIAAKYQTLHTTQINLDIKNFNDPYNFELRQAKLFVKGKVVGVDTILCEPTNCELAPRFQVESWALADTVVRAWTFPKWAGFLYVVNLILIAPALVIIEVVRRIRNHKRPLSGS